MQLRNAREKAEFRRQVVFNPVHFESEDIFREIRSSGSLSELTHGLEVQTRRGVTYVGQIQGNRIFPSSRREYTGVRVKEAPSVKLHVFLDYGARLRGRTLRGGVLGTAI